MFAIVYSIPSIIPKSPTPTPTRQSTKTPAPTTAPEIKNYVFDNFNDSGFDGSVNSNYWSYWAGEKNIVQENGVLMIDTTTESALSSKVFSSFSLSAPISYEAKLKMSSNKHTGAVNIKIGTDISSGPWDVECNIGSSEASSSGWAYCGTYNRSGTEYATDGKAVSFDTWHTFEIEIDPTSMTITFYIDGEEAGSHVAKDANELRQSKFYLIHGTHSVTSGIEGSIDDVRIIME